MPQFDVYRMLDSTLVVDVQSDFIGVTGTRLVIPMIPPDGDAGPSDRLNPEFSFAKQTYVLATHLAGAVSTTALGPSLGSMVRHEYAIKSALDMLISGY